MSAGYVISIWSLLLLFANLNPEYWESKLPENDSNYSPKTTAYSISVESLSIYCENLK
jgi:hypothetical protein